MAQDVGNIARNDYSTGSIPKAILNMALPLTVAQLINIAYSLVDRIYIGRMPGAGSLALTAIGLCLPIITLISGFSSLFGLGGAQLSSIERGKGDIDTAENIMGNSFCLLIICGAALTVLSLVFLKPILHFFGASEGTFDYAADYLGIYMTGNVFVLISLGMTRFISAQGFARTSMITVAIGAIVNIILDPIFIFVLGLGVKGAAIATVIAQGCSMVYTLRFLLSEKAILRLRIKNMRLKAQTVGRITSLGFAGFIVFFTNSLTQMVANVTLGAYGGDVYVGVMTVINAIREVVMLPFYGLTDGSQPVMGFNYGAGKYSRVREAIRFTYKYAFVYLIAVWLVLMLIPAQLMGLLTNDPELIAIGIPAFRTFYIVFPLMAFQLCSQSTFAALGKAKQSIFFSLLRKAVLVTPLTLILPRLGMGVDGVFIAEPISHVIGGAASALTMYFTVYKLLSRFDL